ncbi:MAG: heme biosynthesis protein HemY [Gammaproteobacteria bacterium]
MKLLAYVLLALIAAAGIGLGVSGDPGYVQIVYREWTLETSLVLLVIVLLLAFFAFHYVLRLWTAMRRFPKRLKQLQKQKRLNRARTALIHGFVKLAEGNWAAAEKELTKHTEHSETPLLNYLAAARAAQEQGADDRRDNYLQLAQQCDPSHDVATGLTQATLQIAHKQTGQAIATLHKLRGIAHKNTAVLKLLMTLYIESQEWQHLLELLPDLRRLGVIDGQRADDLECTAHARLLARAAQGPDSLALVKAWQQVPQKLRQHESILSEYARALIAQGAGEQAETMLQESIQKNWSNTLVYLYGLATGADPAKQLARAEAWLKDRENNTVLLLTLGRLCLRNRLWGKARRYLESSIGEEAKPETFQILGQLLERLGEQGNALDCYRKGLALTTDKTIAMPPLPSYPSDAIKGAKRIENAILPVR